MEQMHPIVLAWDELKGLVLYPSEALEGILARRGLVLSPLLGVLGYYWSTLQLSELLTPAPLGERAYFLVNFAVALGRMAIAVTLIHWACRLVVRGGGWWELLSVWGYAQMPAIGLSVLAATSYAIAPSAEKAAVWMLWLVSVVGLALLLSLWGLILRLQTIRICYGVGGKRLLACIALALAFNGACAWLEKMLLDDRGLVPYAAIRAMDASTSPASLGRNNLALPFDILTYHLRRPAKGEIVGFLVASPDGWLPLAQSFWPRSVGRIVAVPGDKVEVKDGQVLLDDQPANEPYRRDSWGISMRPVTVPAAHFFVLGDNRAVPVETYGGGLVPRGLIRGRLTHVGRLKWWLALGTWLW